MERHQSLKNRVKERREALGWSQAELARSSGVSRAGVSAIEVGRLIPSAAAALALAKAMDCRVEEVFFFSGEDAFQSKATWAWVPASPRARFWQAEVGGRLISYPTERVATGFMPHDGIADSGGLAVSDARTARNTLVVACCDPAVGLLGAELLRQTGIRLLAFQRSSGGGLELLKRGFVHAAGVHLAGEGKSKGNLKAVRARVGKGHQLLRVASWEAGVAVRPDEGRFDLEKSLRNARRWVGREEGSGARQCLEELFDGRELPRRVARDHQSVSQLIRDGWADAGICLRLVAEEAGLRFHRVRREPYELCIAESSLGDARVRRLIEVVRSAEYRRLLGELPGYDLSESGRITRVNTND